jgi:hypothetical protein
VNSGTEATNYGYWFPGKANDGAAGGGFMPDPSGRAWIGKEMTRGSWHYSAEEDVGYAGALRSNATIVADDPIFGEIAYGGLLSRSGSRVSVLSRDGLRARFHVIRGATRLHMVLERDGYASDQPIVVHDDLSRIEFVLENRAGTAHETTMAVAGLPAGSYQLSVDDRPAGTITGGASSLVRIPVAEGKTTKVTVRRAGG